MSPRGNPRGKLDALGIRKTIWQTKMVSQLPGKETPNAYRIGVDRRHFGRCCGWLIRSPASPPESCRTAAFSLSWTVLGVSFRLGLVAGCDQRRPVWAPISLNRHRANFRLSHGATGVREPAPRRGIFEEMVEFYRTMPCGPGGSRRSIGVDFQ